MQLARREFIKLTAVAGASASLPRALSAVTGLSSVSAAAPAADDAPAPYRHWQAQARRLLEPIARLFVPGRASLDIHGRASANGAPSDRLESYARPLLLAAHYLQSTPETGAAAAPAAEFRERVARWFREGLVAGSTVGGSQFWGPDANYHQLHVEMGLLCLALQIAPDQLWTPLTRAEKDQVAHWLGSARHTGYVDNNHYFMGIHLLEFLRAQGYGQPGDAAQVDEFFNRLEFLHRGDGWFEDGINQAYDYYEAYAFNFYGLWWARLHGAANPARAQRWREWARRFTLDYQHFFAASGEHPAFGRSITYRFNAVATFGLTVLENCSDLPLGRIRRLCTRNLDFFLRHPIYQDQGCLAIGWLDRFEASAELYTGAASPYWAAKGFSSLLVPPSHPYWREPELPLASETGDHARAIEPAGLVVRSTGGEVELLNAGSQISHVNLRYGAWKWSKTAYRTGRAFTCAFPAQDHWSLDSALTIRLDDGREFGRHSTVALELAEDHQLYRWALGYAWVADGPPDQTNVSVDTAVWWNRGWVLQVHRYEAWQPVVFRLGGYALPVPDAAVEHRQSGPAFATWHATAGGTLLQPLAGFTGREWHERLDGTKPRAHLAAPFHSTPVAVSERRTGAGWLAALAWTGTDPADAQPWAVIRGSAGSWQLQHPTHGDWNIEHAFLPALAGS
ncbi:MAG TPA: DUF2264 domain-containing protein [Opitutus sp.]|nr:DUF2264 domain-containing protein [Opitutus sp.]